MPENNTPLHYPRPVLPPQPVLTWQTLLGSNGEHYGAIADQPEVRYLTSGRVSIANALRLMGVTEQDHVLLPAFHCSSMVEPVVWIGAEFSFYPIQRDTKVDIAGIRANVKPNTKAIIAAHYFGFHQNAAGIRALCDELGLQYLEDCAHAFFGSIDGQPIGSHGDYAIASPMKFFPSFDGGCLASSRHSLAPIQADSASRSTQLKSAINALENAVEAGKMAPMSAVIQAPMWAKDKLWSWVKGRREQKGTNIELAPGSSNGGAEFDPLWLNIGMTTVSRWIMQAAPRKKIVESRRKNYAYLQQQLGHLPGSHSLLDKLPDGCVPQVYPLYVNQAGLVFAELKRRGIPIIRFGEYLWEDVTADICPISIDYSEHLLQFPCHQSLSVTELDWMVGQIRDVILTAENDLKKPVNK